MNFKRIYINSIHQILRAWWFLTRPESRGVKVILKFDDEVLLAQHSYGHRQWTFPGGGVNSKEEYEAAARREMKEELGIEIKNLKSIGSYFTNYEYKKVTVECFVVEVDTKQVTTDNFEIAQVEWFKVNELPIKRAPSVDKIMALYGNK